MGFGKDDLDLVLVPSGLLIMFVYHINLLYRYLHLPHTTVIGFENNDKKAWVERVMQVSFATFFPIFLTKIIKFSQLTELDSYISG